MWRALGLFLFETCDPPPRRLVNISIFSMKWDAKSPLRFLEKNNKKNAAPCPPQKHLCRFWHEQLQEMPGELHMVKAWFSFNKLHALLENIHFNIKSLNYMPRDWQSRRNWNSEDNLGRDLVLYRIYELNFFEDKKTCSNIHKKLTTTSVLYMQHQKTAASNSTYS
jgi:hypothetical protein